MKAAQPKTALMVRIPPEVHEQIRAMADAAGISMTEWVTRCLEDYLATKAKKAQKGALWCAGNAQATPLYTWGGHPVSGIRDYPISAGAMTERRTRR